MKSIPYSLRDDSGLYILTLTSLFTTNLAILKLLKLSSGNLIASQQRYHQLLESLHQEEKRREINVSWNTMMHKYDTFIGYATYTTRRYVYFENNRTRHVIDMWYINIEKCTIILKNIINIWLLLCESKLKLYD